MATKAVTLAQKSGSGAVVLLPHTSADLVGYEKKNSTATTVKEALDEMNDNFQGEKPGIVKRVETLEEKVQPFTAPTASAPGKAGLVPGPEATPDIDRLFRLLAVDGWAKFGAASIGPDPSIPNSRELVVGAQGGENMNADTLASGCYVGSSWTGTPTPDGTVIALPLFARGNEYYGVIQLKFAYGGICAYRTTKSGSLLRVGTKPTSNDWAPWISINAPCPQAAEGVGQWQGISVAATSYTLPIKGVWAYYLSGLVSGQGVITEQLIGAKAGGTVISARQPQTTAISGLVWRIA